MTAPLRVSVVCSHGIVGGAERWLLDMLDSTPRLSPDAVMLAPGRLQRELGDRGLRCQVIPTGSRPAALIGSALRLARVLRATRPDVVLANGVKAGLVAGMAGRIAGARTVWVKHDHSFDGGPMRLLAGLTDGAVATSPTLAATVGRRDAPVIPPPAFRTGLADRMSARRTLADHGAVFGESLTLGLVGRLVGYKGGDDAVAALAAPGARGWRLVVVGDDDPSAPGERQRLTRLAHELGVAARVSFTGAVPDARTLFRAFDALAVLTKDTGIGPGREGFGMTALEALVAGLPVIATGPGAVADLIGSEAGLVVPPAAPAEVAGALARLTLPVRRAEAAAAGMRIAAAHPDPERCADDLARFLAEVAHRPGAGLAGERPVSVVVTVLDEAATIDGLMLELRRQLRMPDDEVVVVDGGSRDGTASQVLEHQRTDARIRLLVRAGAGISQGRNRGIQEARNDLIAVTDAGCRPVPGWLEAFRAAAAERDPAHLLTGVYRVAGGGWVPAAMAAVGYPRPDELRRPSLLVKSYGRLFGRTFDPTMPTGRSVSFTRAAWRRAGGFPEHLRTGEDVLFGRAVATAGRAVLVVGAEVGWDQRGTLRDTARMYYRYGEGSGYSGDRRLLARDIPRVLAYLAAPALLTRGAAGRCALLVGALGYLSLPLARACRHPAAPAVVAVVPVAAAVRDLAKGTGCLAGLLARWRVRHDLRPGQPECGAS